MYRTLASLGLHAAASHRFRTLVARAHAPMPSQWRLFARCVQYGRRTAWGREHGLGRLVRATATARSDRDWARAFADYQAAIPLGDYETFLPYFLRARKGEPDVSWPGTTTAWGMTSGTTSAAGSNKYIPLTDEASRQTRAGAFDILTAYLATSGDRTLLHGQYLFLGGSTALESWPNEYDARSPIYYGDNTGIQARATPRWIRPFYVPGFKTAWIADWEQKLARVTEEAIGRDIRLLAGVPSWVVILFKRVLEKTGAATIAEVWPNLRCYIAGGVAIAPYRATLDRLLGKDIFIADNYGATEGGIIALQDRRVRPDEDDMLVIPDRASFFEFVPAAAVRGRLPGMYEAAATQTLTLEQVELGVDYAIVVTSVSGIFRYLSGDVVRFTCRAPYRLVIAGRLGAFLNYFGEHVSQSEIERAIVHACERTGLRVTEFTVAPRFQTPDQPTPGHRWFVEFSEPHTNGALDSTARTAFAAALDESIASPDHSNNLDYTSHRRSNLGLLPPDVAVVPQGTFYRWMKSRGKLGGQNKIPRALIDTAQVASLEAAAAGDGSPQELLEPATARS